MPHDDKFRDLPPEPASLKDPQSLRELSFAPSTLETIDYAIYDYINDNINFHVTTNKGFEKCHYLGFIRAIISNKKQKELRMMRAH